MTPSHILRWRTHSPVSAACLAASLAFMLAACQPRDLQRIEGMAQGTTYHLTWWSEPPVEAGSLRAAISAEFQRIDAALSNYRPDSGVERFNAALSTEPQAVPSELVELVDKARAVHGASNGCYDLTIKPAFTLWGFQGETLTRPDAELLVKTRKYIGMDKLETTDSGHLRKKMPEVRVDVSSIGQGFSVDKIAKILEKHGIQHYLVEIGGEMKARGHKPDASHWRIAVERPLPGEQRVHHIIELTSDAPLAVMTSGTYRHHFDDEGKRYSHILDARTAAPVTHNLVSVTVLHTDPALADAWSTALLCLGPGDGLSAANQHGIPALLIEQRPDGFVEAKSDAFANPAWKMQ